MEASDRTVRGSRSRAATAALLLGLLVSSCVEDPPRSIRVVMSVGPGVLVPADVNRVVLEMTAMNPSTGGTCIPSDPPWVWELTTAEDLPKIVDLMPGEIYTGQVYVRVRWYQARTTLRAEQVNTTSLTWPANGAREIRFRLDESCLNPPCASGEQCVEGHCVPASTTTNPIDDESTRDPDAGSCDRDAG
jgi:hypothetical protein